MLKLLLVLFVIATVNVLNVNSIDYVTDLPHAHPLDTDNLTKEEFQTFFRGMIKLHKEQYYQFSIDFPTPDRRVSRFTRNVPRVFTNIANIRHQLQDAGFDPKNVVYPPDDKDLFDQVKKVICQTLIIGEILYRFPDEMAEMFLEDLEHIELYNWGVKFIKEMFPDEIEVMEFFHSAKSSLLLARRGEAAQLEWEDDRTHGVEMTQTVESFGFLDESMMKPMTRLEKLINTNPFVPRDYKRYEL